MTDIDFPQSITDVKTSTVFSFVYADGLAEKHELLDPDEFLNDNIMKLPIAVILKDQSFYVGNYDQTTDEDGSFLIHIRSIVCNTCVVAIPFDEIVGWCYMNSNRQANG